MELNETIQPSSKVSGVEFGIMLTIRFYVKVYPLATQAKRMYALALFNDSKAIFNNFFGAETDKESLALSTELYALWEEFSYLYDDWMHN